MERRRSARISYQIGRKRRERREKREFPSKRATVVFGSLERGSHDDLLYIAPNSNSNLLLLLLLLSQKQTIQSCCWLLYRSRSDRRLTLGSPHTVCIAPYYILCWLYIALLIYVPLQQIIGRARPPTGASSNNIKQNATCAVLSIEQRLHLFTISPSRKTKQKSPAAAAAAALYIYIAALQCDDDDMLARPRGFTPRT